MARSSWRRTSLSQPAQALLDHVIRVCQKTIRQLHNLWKEHLFAGSTDQGYTCRPPMPATRRLRPGKHVLHARGFCQNRRRDQVMDESIVVCPTADPVEP